MKNNSLNEIYFINNIYFFLIYFLSFSLFIESKEIKYQIKHLIKRSYLNI